MQLPFYFFMSVYPGAAVYEKKATTGVPSPSASAEVFSTFSAYKDVLLKEAQRMYAAYKKINTYPNCLCSMSPTQIQQSRVIEYMYAQGPVIHVNLIVEENGALKREVCTIRCTCNNSYKLDWSSPMLKKYIFLLADFKHRVMSVASFLQKYFEVKEQPEEERESSSASGEEEDAPAEYIKKFMEQRGIGPDSDIFSVLAERGSMTKQDSEIYNQIIKQARLGPLQK